MFPFDHINYATYNTYQHVYLNNLLRKDKSIAKDLISDGYGASKSGDSFSTIHGDLVTGHFNKETNGTAGLFRSAYSTDIYPVNKWIKTSHIHSKMRTMLRKKLKVFTSQVHKEMTPVNKSCILSMFGALKLSLSNITSTFLEMVQLEISQLVEKLIGKLLMVFCMRKKLETNVSFLLSRTGWWTVKNHSLNLFAK